MKDNINKQYLISIIIPCYNSENFIKTLLDNLLDEITPEIEIICINDGSIDETKTILMDYESRNRNVYVINQNNKGVSAARNNGLIHSKGKYVLFLDSDDSLMPGSISFLLNIIKIRNIDIYSYGYKMCYYEKLIKQYSFNEYNEKLLRNTHFFELFTSKKICACICACLFNKNFLITNNIKFIEGQPYGEDILFLLTSFLKAKKVYYSDRITFIYQLRIDSATNGNSHKNYNIKYFNILKLLENFKNNSKNDLPLSYNYFLAYSYISHLYAYFNSNTKNKIIEENFIKHRYLLKQKFKIRKFKDLIVYLFRFIPIKYLLYIKK